MNILKNKIIKVGFDFHGVIINIIPALRAWIKDVRGFDICLNQTTYDFYQPKNYNKMKDDITEFLMEKQYDCEPVKNSMEFLSWYYNKIKKPLTIITASHPVALEACTEWMNKYATFMYSFFCVDQFDNKVKFCEQEKLDAFVDDRYSTCDLLSHNLKKVYLYDAYYNRNRPLRKNVKRIFTLSDIAKDLL